MTTVRSEWPAAVELCRESQTIMTRPVSADKATQQALDVQYYNWLDTSFAVDFETISGSLSELKDIAWTLLE